MSQPNELIQLYMKICRNLESSSRSSLDNVTKAFKILNTQHSDFLKRKLGYRLYTTVWLKEPHLWGNIIINNGKLDTKQHFTINNLFMTGSTKTGVQYKPTNCYPISNRHLGQRKLLLTEIYFLTNYGHLSDTVLYAGAADGIHIPILCKMFPDKHFYLYDPAKFSPLTIKFAERYPAKLTVINSLFPPDNIKDFKNFLLISDIRSKSRGTTIPTDQDVSFDMQLQQDWISSYKPLASMIKFRLPFLSPDSEDILVKYFPGVIMKQPWAPKKSTETRLITTRKDHDILIKYSSREYESEMFEHNVYFRGAPYSIQINNTIPDFCKYDSCFDCCAEKFILNQYINKFGSDYGRLYKLIDKTLGREDYRMLA